MNYFITAISTDSGKTLVSAMLCEALHADYWKPVQSGMPADSETVRTLLSNHVSKIHKERFRLTQPMSPHAAARIDGVKISLEDFSLPSSKNRIIIEGAGGCLVPLNDTDVVIDLAVKLQTSVIVVSNFYLGSINHTLLTIEALRSRRLNVLGIVFNGERNEESEKIILGKSQLRKLFHVPKVSNVNREFIKSFAEEIKLALS